MPDFPFDIFIKVTLGEKRQAAVAVNGQAPEAWSGDPMRCRVAFFKADGKTLADVTQIADASAQIELTTRDGNAIVAVNASGVINTDLTLDQWNAREAEHAVFYFDAASMELPVAAGDTATEYYLVFYGHSTDQDAVEQPDTFGWAKLKVYNDGVAPGSPLSPVPSRVIFSGGIPMVGMDGLTHLVKLKLTGSTWDLDVDQVGDNSPGYQKMIVKEDGGTQYHDVTLVQQDGIWTLNVDPTAYTP